MIAGENLTRVLLPVRTRKFGHIKFCFNVYRGGNHPASSQMETRSHRYRADLGSCYLPTPGRFFHKFDFATVLPVLKTTAVCNLLVTIGF
jgi:hypothetical protein